jgi:hypothetical protein
MSNAKRNVTDGKNEYQHRKYICPVCIGMFQAFVVALLGMPLTALD